MLLAPFGLSQLVMSLNMLAKMILSGKLSGSRPVPDMNTLNFSSDCTKVSHRVPAVLFLFLQLLLFISNSAFFFPNIRSNAPGPVKKTNLTRHGLWLQA